MEMEKAVVEGAGACGLAAVLSGQLPELKGKRYYKKAVFKRFIIFISVIANSSGSIE
jgi:threonine dehydratase